MSNWDHVAAMFGLCRMGKAAAQFANEIRAKLLTPDPNYGE